MSSKKTALLVLVLLAAALAAFFVYRARSLTDTALLKRLPTTGAMVLHVDFNALRRAGIMELLDGSKIGEDPEYKAFVANTGFNYTRDLDLALVAFAPTGRFLLLRGRFDWPKLRRYAESQQGSCADSVCRMVGSTPDRRISFFPLQSNVMAMAVSTDDFGARRLATPGAGPDPQTPDAPVWLALPPSVLKGNESLPQGTRMFARSIESADSVTLALAPDGRRLAAKLNVLCRSEQDASQVATELGRITALLRDLIEREHQTPNPADLSGVLSSGSFRTDGRRVYGYWPIERKFVENMLGGA